MLIFPNTGTLGNVPKEMDDFIPGVLLEKLEGRSKVLALAGLPLNDLGWDVPSPSKVHIGSKKYIFGAREVQFQ